MANIQHKSTLKTTLKKSRKALLEKLLDKKWYKRTSPLLRKKLFSLPPDFDPFLKDLTKRPESLGRIEIIKLIKLARGNFTIIPVFEVRSLDTNEVFTYEYASWKYGAIPGYRGIIFVRVNNKIKYFLIRKIFKFSLAKSMYDSISVFTMHDSQKKTFQLSKKLDRKINKILGTENINIAKYIDLGIIVPDPGLLNTQNKIFAIIIDVDNTKEIERNLGEREFTKNTLGYQLEVHSIKKLSHFISKISDSHFLACVARLKSMNILE